MLKSSSWSEWNLHTSICTILLQYRYISIAVSKWECMQINKVALNFAFCLSFWCNRNLNKPIAVQSKEKEDRYVDNYRVLQHCRI